MGLLWTSVRNETNNKSPEKIIHEEKRAPTDESIRLYREMEEKIHSEIAERLMVKDNVLNYTLSFTNHYMMCPKMYIKMKINEKEFSEVFNLNDMNKFSIEDDIYEKLKNWICEKILINPIKNVCQSIWSKSMDKYVIIDDKFIPKA